MAFYVPPIMAILRKAARWRLVVIIISPERSFIPFIPFLSKLLNLWPLGFSLRPFYPLFIHSHTMAKVQKNINCQMTNLNFRAKSKRQCLAFTILGVNQKYSQLFHISLSKETREATLSMNEWISFRFFPPFPFHGQLHRICAAAAAANKSVARYFRQLTI